jgi:hypothetical protein
LDRYSIAVDSFRANEVKQETDKTPP